LAAPFLARCPDISGRTQHPMEVRRPRWYLRRGRGQEDLAPSLALRASPPGALSSTSGPAFSAPSGSEKETSTEGVEKSVPAAVVISGRAGAYDEVNGRYELSKSTWGGRPVYLKADGELESPLAALDLEKPLALFFDHGFWAVAREVCSLPRALARCRPAKGAESSSHPADGGIGAAAAWEFLCDESKVGHMVSADTRKYMVDRNVLLQAIAADGSVIPSAAPAAALKERGQASAEVVKVDEERGQGEVRWVASASAEVAGDEVRVSIIMHDSVSVDMQSLGLEVAHKVLKVALTGYDVFEFKLPAAVDADANPKARWMERTRTLRVRLSLDAAAAAATSASAPLLGGIGGGGGGGCEEATSLGGGVDDGMD